MIEFRGKCGHLIRARDGDAGNVVNCAYCGQPARVPQSTAAAGASGPGDARDSGPAATDSILAESLDDSLMPAADADGENTVLHKISKAAEPIRVIWTALFVIILISVLVITVRWVTQLVRGGTTSRTGVVTTPVEPRRPDGPTPPAPASPPSPVPEPAREPAPFRDAFGELPQHANGLYVGSVPDGLNVYVHRLPDEAGADLIDKNHYKGTTPAVIELGPGTYRVSVVAPLRHQKIAEYANYRDLREAVRLRNRNAVAAYFIDDGSEVSLTDMQGRETLIKTYEVSISGQGWVPLICLMLPDGAPNEMLMYVPLNAQYRYSVLSAETELSIFDVPKAMHDSIKRLLSYCGKAVYVDSQTGRTVVFQVWPDAEVVARETVDETIPPEARP